MKAAKSRDMLVYGLRTFYELCLDGLEAQVFYRILIRYPINECYHERKDLTSLICSMF